MNNRYKSYIRQNLDGFDGMNYTEFKPTNINYSGLAMVYAEMQEWRYISDGENGFKRGTIFDELDKPFKCDTFRKGGQNR